LPNVSNTQKNTRLLFFKLVHWVLFTCIRPIPPVIPSQPL